MKWYADSSRRRTWQIVADVFVVCWVALCVWFGRAVNDGISSLRGPADSMASAGSSFQQNMAGASDNVSGIPIVGGALQSPFDALSGAGQQLAAVGSSVGSTVDTVARAAGVVVAVVPILVALLVWGFFRVRFVRRATAATRYLAAPGSLELFALRALTRQPLRRLAPLGPDLASRFRDGDPLVLRQLAALELRACGVGVDGGEESPPRLTRLA